MLIDSHVGDRFSGRDVGSTGPPDATPLSRSTSSGSLASSGCGARRASFEGASSPRAAKDATIIFDWDDTLFPTWYVHEVVLACSPKESLSKGGALPADSPFAPELARHALVVEKVLRAAREHGRVAIVTLAAKPWVKTSSERWLPTLNFAQLQRELKIEVVYARDCLKRHTRSEDPHVNIYTAAKALAMQKVVTKLIRDEAFGGNLISIGDSHFEACAAKDLLWGISTQYKDLDPVCKTVKLLDDPNLQELRLQLDMVVDWLQPIVSQSMDFDLCLMAGEDGGIERIDGMDGWH